MTYLQGAFRSFDDDADDISFRFSNGSLNQPADLVSHALPSETKTQSVTTTADISLHSGAVPSSETITYAGSGLVFVNTYGSGVNDAYRSAIIQAENAFQSHFTNSVTLRLTFDEQLINTSYSGQNTFGNSLVRGVSYATLNTALHNYATSSDDIAAVNALPATDPSGGRGFDIPIGMARVLGLAPAGSSTDDSIVLNSYYWTGLEANAAGVLEHEISEGAMGRIGSLGVWDYYWAPMDLFRWSSVGQRDYTGGHDGLSTYFSVDGNQLLTQYHNSVNASGNYDNFDLADWEGTSGDAFGPGGPSSPSSMTATDLRVMDILGWTPTGPNPLPTDDYRNSLNDSSHPFGSVAINGSSTGRLEVTGDRDWFQVQLVAGTQYTINEQGSGSSNGTLSDPYMRLHDNAGTLLTSNDDSNGLLDSQIVFTASYTGTYYIEAGAYNDGLTGTYRIAISGSSVNHAPVVTAPSTNVTANAGQSIAASSLFNVSDSDNDVLTYYLYDATAGANSGHWVVNGNTVADQTVVALSASQFANATFVAGSSGAADTVSLMVYDGHTYSGNTSFTSTHVNVPGVNHAPVVTATSANVTANAGQSIAASSLFSVSDSDNDVLTYYLYDATAGASSGHWVVNGNTIADQTVVALSANQFANASFVAGSSGAADTVSLLVYDGHTYSGNTSFTSTHVNVAGANHAPVVNIPSANVAAGPGQTIVASNLFSASDVDGDTLTYFLYDATPGGGHWLVNGNTIADRTVVALSANDVAHTSFVAGGLGSNDDLQVMVYDGHTYSGNTSFSHFHVIA